MLRPLGIYGWPPRTCLPSYAENPAPPSIALSLTGFVHKAQFYKQNSHEGQLLLLLL